MKRNERKDNFFKKKKKVSEPSNPPDESAPKCFEKKKKSPSDELFLHFSSKVESSEYNRVFIYLHDSNSIFRARRINSEWVSAHIVCLKWKA